MLVNFYFQMQNKFSTKLDGYIKQKISNLILCENKCNIRCDKIFNLNKKKINSLRKKNF